METDALIVTPQRAVTIYIPVQSIHSLRKQTQCRHIILLWFPIRHAPTLSALTQHIDSVTYTNASAWPPASTDDVIRIDLGVPGKIFILFPPRTTVDSYIDGHVLVQLKTCLCNRSTMYNTDDKHSCWSSTSNVSLTCSLSNARLILKAAFRKDNPPFLIFNTRCYFDEVWRIRIVWCAKEILLISYSYYFQLISLNNTSKIRS